MNEGYLGSAELVAESNTSQGLFPPCFPPTTDATAPSSSPRETRQRTVMPPTTIAQNLRPPPSSIVEPVQRSPVLSPRIADPKQQQRSGSVHPPSPPQRASTPPQRPSEKIKENGSKKSEASAHCLSNSGMVAH